jgi:hypothetical protein
VTAKIKLGKTMPFLPSMTGNGMVYIPPIKMVMTDVMTGGLGMVSY